MASSCWDGQSQVLCVAHLEIASLSLVPGASYIQKNVFMREDNVICHSYQDDREENSHVLTDFFLEELLRFALRSVYKFLRLFRSENYCFFFRTNVTGNSMFHLPDSFQVRHHNINKILHFVHVFM